DTQPPHTARQHPLNRGYVHQLKFSYIVFILFNQLSPFEDKCSCIALAALLPSPMARITVAPPRTISPPAKIKSSAVCIVSLFTTIVPQPVISKPVNDCGMSGLGDT